MDFDAILQSMSRKRPVFHSQVDLRDALAGEMRIADFSYSLNKEMGKNQKIDIWVEDKHSDKVYAFEVRYKTALLNSTYNGNNFDLKLQLARDQARYDFINDIVKLEHIIKSRPDMKAYAILITNDHLYWNISKRHGTIDEQFHIHEGRSMFGELQWGYGASDGTMKDRTAPLILVGEYKLAWRIYSMASSGKNGTFKALVVEVGNK